MIQLFYQGGPLFLTLISLPIIALIVVLVRSRKNRSLEAAARELGSLALALGVLGSLIGLFEGFQAVEQMGGVSPEMLMGGLKVSLITSLYGLFGYLLSRAGILGLKWAEK